MNKIILKGIAWDHPRGYQPLQACSKEFQKLNPDVELKWNVRSLKEFGDMPIEELVNDYDLITIDHPYMGQADEDGLLLPLEDYIADKALELLSNQSVGPSFKSYIYNKLYAVPIDAAAQVAACKPRVFQELNLSIPSTRGELRNLYKKIPSDFSVIWPLCSVDAICSFLTLGAQENCESFIHDKNLNEKITIRVIDELKFHLQNVHPDSIDINPIQALDKMRDSEGIMYSPYLFGYTNYSRISDNKKRIVFRNSPNLNTSKVSTLLGGVGLSVSAFTEHPNEAAEFITFVSSAEIQRSIYTMNSGQPGNILAWLDQGNNDLCANFFQNTIQTMENAYVRPRYPLWNSFQERGGEILNLGLKNEIETDLIAKHLIELFNSIFNGGTKI